VALSGGEIALHGINAWASEEHARLESKELTPLAASPRPEERGVRMHWLYFDADAWQCLEAAGFSYDSTWGYNETVGYRAGTSQVFRPLCATTLLELPLHVMDTSLFYASYLNLTPLAAQTVLSAIVQHARESGGTVTVNWHDRSLFPER
jgi:hypothetical protein